MELVIFFSWERLRSSQRPCLQRRVSNAEDSVLVVYIAQLPTSGAMAALPPARMHALMHATKAYYERFGGAGTPAIAPGDRPMHMQPMQPAYLPSIALRKNTPANEQAAICETMGQAQQPDDDDDSDPFLDHNCAIAASEAAPTQPTKASSVEANTEWLSMTPLQPQNVAQRSSAGAPAAGELAGEDAEFQGPCADHAGPSSHPNAVRNTASAPGSIRVCTSIAGSRSLQPIDTHMADSAEAPQCGPGKGCAGLGFTAPLQHSRIPHRSACSPSVDHGCAETGWLENMDGSAQKVLESPFHGSMPRPISCKSLGACEGLLTQGADCAGADCDAQVCRPHVSWHC